MSIFVKILTRLLFTFGLVPREVVVGHFWEINGNKIIITYIKGCVLFKKISVDFQLLPVIQDVVVNLVMSNKIFCHLLDFSKSYEILGEKCVAYSRKKQNRFEAICICFLILC